MRKATFNIIAAVSKNRGIGYNNTLPWKYNKIDMEHFMNLTKNTHDPNKVNSVIMGRNTWNSIGSVPLINRANVVVSSTKIRNDNGMVVSENSFDRVLSRLSDHPQIETNYVIGGEQLYRESILHPNVDKIYLTEINEKHECDTYFPDIPKWFELVNTEKFYNGMCINTYKNRLSPNSDEYSYLNCLRDVLNNGELVENDRTGVGAITSTSNMMKFNIDTLYSSDEDILYQVPVITTKSIYLRGVILELLWFMKGITNTKWLSNKGVNIWDGNSSREFLDSLGLEYPDGEIGPTYGHQFVNCGGDYESKTGGINQIEYVINELRNNPTSRRALINLWHVPDLDKMALPPCQFKYTFYITGHNTNPQLNCSTTMRSADMFLGVPFNITSASLFTILLSRVLNILPGEVSIACDIPHIYSNHVEQVKTQLERKPLEFPTLTINKDINSFDDIKNLSVDNFHFNDYYHYPSLKGKMAV